MVRELACKCLAECSTQQSAAGVLGAALLSTV
jgi:hypothetical protein